MRINMQTDSTDIYCQSERQISSPVVEETQEFENKSCKARSHSKSQDEISLSSALSHVSEGEGLQAVIGRYFNSLLSSERKEDQTSEQRTSVSESIDAVQNMPSGDLEDLKLPELHENHQTLNSEAAMQTTQEPLDSDEVITIRMTRKRKAGELEPSMLAELSNLTSEDPDRMFLLSMIPAMKRVRLDKVDEVKLKILKVIRKNRCPSTMNASTESENPSKLLTLSERAISNADGEPAVPDPDNLMDRFSLSAESESGLSSESPESEKGISSDSGNAE